MTFIVSFVALAIAFLVLAVVVGLILTLSGSRFGSSRPSTSAEMNEGDFHSSPLGYSPNTEYPETFYGSGGQSGDDEESAR